MFVLRSVLLFLIGFLSVQCSKDKVPRFRPDYQYVPDVNGWLKFHQVHSTWQDAVERCRLEGATLMSPTDDLALNAMRDNMKENQHSPCPIFTGIHATFSKRDFHTIEGVPLHEIKTTINFTMDSCDDEVHDCIAMDPLDTVYNAPCDRQLPFICYKKNSGEEWANLEVCGTADPAYSLVPDLGSCYKFHVEPKIWQDAFKTCSAEGGYLAIINSEKEVSYLKSYFQLYPPHTWISEYKDTVLLGYRVWGEQNAEKPKYKTYSTIHGQTLKEAGYESWEQDQPNGSGDCGGMFTTGLLNDVWCNVAFPFICEKDPRYSTHF